MGEIRLISYNGIPVSDTAPSIHPEIRLISFNGVPVSDLKSPEKRNNKNFFKQLSTVVQECSSSLLNQRSISIIQANNPIAAKQLAIVIALLKYVDLNKDERKLAYDWARKQAAAGQMGSLGRLAYLLDHKQIKAGWFRSSFSLEKDFARAMALHEQQLGQQWKSSACLGKEWVGRFWESRLPYLFADLLLLKKGGLNLGLTESLNFYFKKMPKQMKRVLGEISTNETLQREIEGLSAPHVHQERALLLIRSTLGLPQKSPVTDRDVRQTVLSALLSRSYQERAGSCFVTPLLNSLLSSHPERITKDFISLLNRQAIVRQVNGKETLFPYILSVDTVTHQLEIKITSKGEVIPAPWEHPLFAPLQISRSSYQKALETRSQKGKKATLSVAQIFHRLSQNGSLPSSERLLAFEAQFSHPLLSAWKTSIASMTEANADGLVRSTLLNAIAKTLEHYCQNGAELQTLIMQLKKELSNAAHFHYDASLTNKKSSRDGHSQTGGFLLFHKNKGAAPAQWWQITSPEQFQAWLLRALEKVKRKSENQRINPSLFNQIADLFKSRPFLSQLLKAYHPDNQKIADPLSDLDKLSYTPWASCCGNSLEAALRCWSGKLQEAHIIRARDAGQLLSNLITEAKKDPQSFDQECMVRIAGLHAFCLTLDDPKFRAFCQGELLVGHWIESQRRRMADDLSLTQCEELLLFAVQHFIPLSYRQRFRAQIRAEYRNLTPLKFRALLVRTVCHFRKNLSQIKVAQAIDKQLIAYFPQERVAIPFAQTNWRDQGHSVQLVFLLNPGSGKIEVWSMRDDYSGLKPLDQREWVCKNWELYSIPAQRKPAVEERSSRKSAFSTWLIGQKRIW